MPEETLADALAAARKMLDDDSWIDDVTALDEDGEPDDFAQRVVRANDVRDALARIEAAAKQEAIDAELKWTRIGYDERKAEEKRAPGNAAAMRAALESVEDDCRVLDRKDMWEEEGECYYDALRDIRETVSAALTAPPRNCDVGTAVEQYGRWSDFCIGHYNSAYAALGNDPCNDCPLGDCDANGGSKGCQLAWAQMPFAPAEGGAE